MYIFVSDVCSITEKAAQQEPRWVVGGWGGRGLLSWLPAADSDGC